MRRRLFLLFFGCLNLFRLQAQVLHFVFTSDLHYGITRPHFRGNDSVASFLVNKAQVKAINALPAVGISHLDGILVTGDIANREEAGIQAASVCWQQFLHDYQQGIRITSNKGGRPALWVTPGNHDASSAAGHSKIMFRDAGSMTGMFLLEEKISLDTARYQYQTQELNYSRDIDGLHFVFVNLWPDSANRLWLQNDLASLTPNTPVFLFTHDPPVGDARHFTNPDSAASEQAGDPFEHLLSEVHKDTAFRSTQIEQEGLTLFLQSHPNIKAWFHGHENFCQMYDYAGTKQDFALPVFRSDSPMKGEQSRPDETKLSFQVITIDVAKKTLTSRECFWNRAKASGRLSWGISRTIHW